MAAPTVLATSGNLSGIKRIIGQYYYSSNIRMGQLDARTYAVYNAKGRVWDVIVIKKGKRWYFQTTHGMKAEYQRPRRNPGDKLVKVNGFKVRILYHTWGGSQPYYLHTEEGGVILVKSKGDKFKPTIYPTKLDAISGINSFMRLGRDITALSIVKV